MSRVLPILFNTEMVRAILDGRKGATRRIVKGFIPDDAIWGYTAFTLKGYISCRGTFADEYGEKFFKLPCEKGDILYAQGKELTAAGHALHMRTETVYRTDALCTEQTIRIRSMSAGVRRSTCQRQQPAFD